MVFSPSLDHDRRRYALTNKICCGPCKQFANTSLEKQFPNHISRIPPNKLTTENGDKCLPKHFDSGRRKENVFVATAFGITGGLIRQKDLRGFACIPQFQSLVDHINEFDLRNDLDVKGTNVGDSEELKQSKKLVGLETQLVDLKKKQSPSMRTFKWQVQP